MITVAQYALRLAREAVRQRQEFLLVLSGGSTPRPLFQLMAEATYRQEFPWSATHVFWADERMVSPDDSNSNFAMAHDLLLQHVAIPEANIHRIRGELGATQAAADYAHVLMEAARQHRMWPRFDLVLLGMGSDGHTASLFPGSIHPWEKPQPTVAVVANYGDRPSERVSLTPPVFNDARHVIFLVTGEDKAPALAKVLQGPSDAVGTPAQRIKPRAGTIIWYVDAAAAGKLDTSDQAL